MRHLLSILTIAALATLGCGADQPTTDQADITTADGASPAEPAQSMPDDDVHAQAMDQAMGGPMHSGGGLNADITLDPEIADDWGAIRVRVVDLETGEGNEYEVAIGDTVELGDSGLTLKAETFLPDFVMSENGITSRSAEPQNPAARVVISEQGKPDHHGWLFAAMPAIHAFQHERYGVVLVEGIPAE
jgi:hypothetical protein